MIRKSKKVQFVTSMALTLTVAFSSALSYAVPLTEVETGFAKNVIIMIPDGMSSDGVTLARWVYNDGEALYMDSIASGLVSTHNADTAIADSAPAGTAMATGYKTQDKLIGVKPAATTLEGAKSVEAGYELAPAASILEAAKLSGKAVGIVATSEIQHATPADFSSHTIHRNMYTVIGEQQVYQDMDVVLGGGRDYLLKDTTGSTNPQNKTRIDDENMQEAIKASGYNYVTTRSDMMKVTSGKLWGAFTSKAMSKDLVKGSEEPSLSEMTSKAIELLSKDQEGFFLMVEGSQVDWAAHGNQTVGLISEIKAFDDAVGVALEYAKSNKDTLVIVASDHGNGGISIGDSTTTNTYSTLPIDYFTATLKAATITEEAAAAEINAERTNIAVVMEKLGIKDLTEDEIARLKATENLLGEISKVVYQRAHIGWTTGGHTGEDVVLYVYANDNDNQLSGTVQNSDIAEYAAKALGLDLDAASEALFVPQSALAGLGYKVEADLSDITNPTLNLTKDGKTYTFHENKNIFTVAGKDVAYNGINVYNGKQFFIPQAALDLITPPLKPVVENTTPVTETESMTYTVKAGDVLWKIAEMHKTTTDALVKLNSLKNPNLIEVGQVLKIK